MSTQIIYLLILTITLVIGVARFKLLTTPFKILTCSVLTILLLEITSEVILAFRYKQNNFNIYHLESLSGYVFYAATYFYIFKNKVIKKAIVVSVVLVFVFFLINALFIQPFNQKFPTNIYLITDIFLVMLALLLFKQMLQYPLNINIVKQSIFWFNTGMIFFSTTMFLNWGLMNYYAEHNWGYDIIYYFWIGNLYLFNALICVSLFTDNKVSSTTYEH